MLDKMLENALKGFGLTREKMEAEYAAMTARVSAVIGFFRQKLEDAERRDDEILQRLDRIEAAILSRFDMPSFPVKTIEQEKEDNHV
jgi:hypothetical protein